MGYFDRKFQTCLDRDDIGQTTSFVKQLLIDAPAGFQRISDANFSVYNMGLVRLISCRGEEILEIPETMRMGSVYLFAFRRHFQSNVLSAITILCVSRACVNLKVGANTAMLLISAVSSEVKGRTFRSFEPIISWMREFGVDAAILKAIKDLIFQSVKSDSVVYTAMVEKIKILWCHILQNTPVTDYFIASNVFSCLIPKIKRVVKTLTIFAHVDQLVHGKRYDDLIVKCRATGN